MKRFFILAAMLLLASCKELPQGLKDWQQKQIQKRYGSQYDPNPEKIPEWQEDLLDYEEEIEEKIEAADKAGRLYRKIGESYASVEMFDLCIENLNRAIELGYTIPDVYYSLGLCQGSRARQHNWTPAYVKEAEETFLKVLHLSPGYEKAKYQLSILYFYGFSRVQPYRVRHTSFNVSQAQYREHALELMTNYQKMVPDDPDSYFALGGYYSIAGQNEQAADQYRRVMNLFIRQYPKSYQNLPAYNQAAQNLSLVSK